MPRNLAAATRLVADIGGTNTRLALYDPACNELRALRRYLNRDYTHLEDIIEDWLKNLTEPGPADGCLAIAAPPPLDGKVSMFNIDWQFCAADLIDHFGFSQLRCINDFEGNAYALPHLPPEDLVTLHKGETTPGSRLATVGPGTGLGGSTLDTSGPTPIANACEPGHMGLSPVTETELALFQYLLARHGEVYAELLLCGAGLQCLHQALGAVRGVDVPELAPEDITTRGLAEECDLCHETLEIFCALLGSVCGDFVLANGAYGGLYVAGGIAPQMVAFLRDSAFTQRFQEKGRMGEHLQRVPLHIITGQTTGLLGAAHATL